ncbi:MAG: hypothetical protein JWM28_794 [Chitinophagaceae bacterium]|nr:hypothetical protein [Chitinophagaceae bacterium]
MKVIHLNKNFSSHKTGHELLEIAKQLETEGDKAQAVAVYEEMIKKKYQKELGYQRVMILLRGLKEYRRELEVVNRAIDDFKKLYSGRNALTNKKAINTSRKLIKLMGLKDNLNDYPQPLPRWLKRKQALKKKMSGYKKN